MKSSYLLAIFPALLIAGSAHAQYPVMDMIADSIVQKYQGSNCEQLWAAKGKPKSEREQEMLKMLRADPQMRAAFVNKVAPTIVNKMFECGMVP